MTDLAWMKVYIGDEAALTVHLTAEEFGAYERLRRHYWQHGGLPCDDSRLMRITGVDVGRWEEVRSGICELFAEGWRLPRLDEARSQASDQRERAVARSHKAADARWNRKAGHASSIASGNPTSSPPSNARRMHEAVPQAVLEECPPAPAPDEVRYDERLAPTHVHARTRDDDLPTPFDVPETEAEGREYLVREGLWPKEVAELLPILMRGALHRPQIHQALARRKG